MSTNPNAFQPVGRRVLAKAPGDTEWREGVVLRDRDDDTCITILAVSGLGVVTGDEVQWGPSMGLIADTWLRDMRAAMLGRPRDGDSARLLGG